MFDMEKALKEVKFEIQGPNDKLRKETRQNAAIEFRKTQSRKQVIKLPWAIPATAMIFALLFLVMLPITAEGASYYTIDINPSISMRVDGTGMVLDVTAENDDAKVLLSQITLTHLTFEDALKTVVEAADALGYVKDNGHVLVACFGDKAVCTQQQIEQTVAEATRRKVRVLLLKGTKDRFEKAKEQHLKPGIELLKELAEKYGDTKADVDTMIDCVRDNLYEYGGSESGNVGKGKFSRTGQNRSDTDETEQEQKTTDFQNGGDIDGAQTDGTVKESGNSEQNKAEKNAESDKNPKSGSSIGAEKSQESSEIIGQNTGKNDEQNTDTGAGEKNDKGSIIGGGDGQKEKGR